MCLGILFVIISGFLGALIASLMIRGFDNHEKRIQIFQQMCSRGIMAYMLALQSSHYSIMHFVLITECVLFLVLETMAKVYLVYYLNKWGSDGRSYEEEEEEER